MPVQRCQSDNKPGWRCGEQGKCYTYTEGNEQSEKRAKQKAIDQCIAIGEDPGAEAVASIEHHNKVVRAGRRRADRLEQKLVSAIERVFYRAADQSARNFKRHATDHFTAAGDGPPNWTPPLADEVINVPALVEQFRGKTDPVRQALIAAVMGPTLAGSGIDFDITNPLTAKVLAQSGSQIVDIAATTQLNVMRIIRESYEQGLSVRDTAKAIRGGMRAATPARALLIARTELVGAVNGGSLAATQIVSGVSETAGEGRFMKQWLTAEGAVYPRHEEYEGLDGQVVELDAPFDVGGFELQFPGDPDGPPEEICNCRCALAYVEAGQDEGGTIVEGGAE